MDKKTAKDTVFSTKNKTKFYSIGPSVMGVVNITDDSFYKASRVSNTTNLLAKVEQFLNDGATIIDVGGCSSRPGAKLVDQNIEEKRVLPAIESILKEFPDAVLSIDTFRSDIATRAVHLGVKIINDVSAGKFDSKMFKTAAKLNVPYVLMHMQGSPSTMQKNPEYTDVFSEVYDFFKIKLDEMKLVGLENVIIDPGFGFGKTVEQNYQLLYRLNEFENFNKPILVGFSRKSMIGKVLGCKSEDLLNGTTVLNTIALINGASILRVHDVKEAVEAVQLLKAYSS